MELIRDNRFDEYIRFVEPRGLKSNPDAIRNWFLSRHNHFAGLHPSIAYHLIDKEMYEKITADKTKLTIPLVLKRKNLKDTYIEVQMNKEGDRWFVSYIQ